MIQSVIRRLREAGHSVDEIGILRPDHLLRVNNGPELTQVQFLQVADAILASRPILASEQGEA